MKKRLLAILLVVCLAVALVPAVSADGYSDTDGHWAESAIDRWSGYGIVEGSGGKFDPSGEMTRGQIAAIIARLLKLPEAESAGFEDTDGHWAEDYIDRCAAAGIMLGDGVNARPGDAVSREEAMVLLARALGIKPVEKADLNDYKDAKKVSSWAKGYVAALTEKGIVNGIDGSLAPASDINRASAMTIIDKAISEYANQDGQIVTGSGEGIVLVAAKNVTVTGEADSIVVSAGAEGGTTNITGAKADSVTVQASESAVNISNSEVKDVAVDAPKAEVTLTNTKTENVEVSEKAEEAKLEVGAGATVDSVANKADGTTVSGSGKVENVETSGDNTKVETNGTKVEAAPGTTGTTAGGQTVAGGSTATTTPSTPSVHYHSYISYTANDDGTHTGKCACNATGTETCVDGSDEDTKCDKCGDDVSAYVVSHSNGKKYKTFEEAVAIDGTVTLLKDVKLEANVEIGADDVVVIDLNGKNITVAYAEGSETNHIYAFTNKGDLTIKSSVAGGAINSRGIFNYGEITLVSGSINSIDGNGGYAVRNYSGASFVMNGGTVAATYEDDHLVDNGGYDATPLRVDSGATATINGGDINNVCDYTFAIDNAGTVEISGGTVTSVHSTVSSYGTMNISGGTFICDGLEGVTAHALVAWNGSKTTISGGTFNGKDNYNGFNIDAVDGAEVVITGGNFLPVHSGSLYGNGTITVKGGTFFDDPSARVAPGYKAYENEDTTWTVEKLFEKGSGTQADPFIIDSIDSLKKIADVKEYGYFKVADGVTTLDGSSWTSVNMVGSFDGNGVTINNLSAALFNKVGARNDETNTYTIKNITINANISGGTSVALIKTAPSKLVVENVDVHGFIEGTTGTASYIGYGPANNSDKAWGSVPFDVTFKNCVSDATLVANDDCAVGFIKHPYSSATETKINLIDSAYIGHMYGIKATSMKYFIGNGNDYFAKTEYSSSFISDLGLNPEGTLYVAGTKAADGYMKVGNYPTNGGVADKYIYSGHNVLLIRTTGSLEGMAVGDVFTVAKVETAVNALVTLEIAPNDTNGTGSYLGTYMIETIDLSEVTDTFTTSEIKYFNITINGDAAAGLTGNTYNVVNSFYGTTHNGATVRIVQHDANGIPVSIVTYRIAAAG